MTLQTQLTLSKYDCGRMLIHLLCIRRDHRVRYHLKGVVREFKHIFHCHIVQDQVHHKTA